MRNYDPRSKIFNKDGSRRTDENGDLIKTPAERQIPISAEERKQCTFQNVVIVCTVGESCSWGRKHDGYVYLPNAAALEKFRAYIQARKTRESYTFIETTLLLPISEQGLAELVDSIKKNSERPWNWSDTDYAVAPWH